MSKWVIRSLLALFLCTAINVIWFFSVSVWPAIQHIRAHRRTWETASPARLQLLARQSVDLTKKLSSLNESHFFFRGRGDIPAEFKDLDPTWMSVEQNELHIELLGGFDHFGFIIRKMEDSPNTWEILRYTEQGAVQSGTFNSENPSERGNLSP